VDECEVCLQPIVGWSIITFDTPEAKQSVRFCRGCLDAVFEVMAKRWNDAVREGNAAVDAMKKMFGIDVDQQEVTQEAWVWICGCREQKALTHCRKCGMDRPPRDEKRGIVNDNDQAALVEQVTKRFTDEGRLIEAGWQGMRIMVLSSDVPDAQLVEMRKIFFAGAQHLFASIMAIMEEGAEPTDADLQRMELIHKELEGFADELRRELRKRR
jgi:hypothetical protein